MSARLTRTVRWTDEHYRPARPGVLPEELATCGRCLARPGEMCVSTSGKPAWVPHTTRGELGYMTAGEAYLEGADAAIELVEAYIVRALRDTEDSSGRGDLATSVQTALALAKRQFVPR